MRIDNLQCLCRMMGFLLPLPVAIVTALSLSACGGEKGTSAPEIVPPDTIPMMPEREIEPEVPTGDTYVRAAVTALESLTAVEWAQLRDDGLYVSVVKSVLENDNKPVYDACSRVQKSGGDKPLTAYLIDSTLATEDWKPGDPGELYVLKLPLALKIDME